MVNYQYHTSEEQMDLIFHSLADPTRREILKRLATENMTVTKIAEPYDISLPAITKHLKVLERANLIKREKHGREYDIQLEPATLHTAEEYIRFYKKFWNTQLTSLERFLKRT